MQDKKEKHARQNSFCYVTKSFLSCHKKKKYQRQMEFVCKANRKGAKSKIWKYANPGRAAVTCIEFTLYGCHACCMENRGVRTRLVQ